MTGQIVVETTKVSVVTKVLFAEAGQSDTLDGQAVMVAVRVLRMVDVVLPPSVPLEPPWSEVPVVVTMAVG